MKPLLDFFQFASNPFGDTPNTDFLYPSPAHREAFASLVWAIQAGRGFVGLTAVPGMGKTTLLFHLMRTLEGHATTAFVFQTQCSPSEMLRLLMPLSYEFPGQNHPRPHRRCFCHRARNASRGDHVACS